MFAHSRNIAITGGNFSISAGISAFDKLQKASAPSAFHNSSTRFDPPKCHPNTRVAVLEYLMEWIFGRKDPDALILWLYGPAGAGKSAILQTIAERCFERNVLLASFFFARSDPTRNTFKPLVATIAYQILIAIPEIKPIVESVIERDPLIFDKSMATQLQSLIINPLKHLIDSGILHTFARLVLIDGLDECDDPRMQSMILRALAGALRDHKLPFIFLLASRAEQHISLTFNSPSLAGLWRSLVLDDKYKPDDDIRLFLTDSFQEIKLAHPHRHLIPETWPEPSDINKLVRKSSGQFIYSSVVVKYVSSPIDRPPRRLEVTMGLRSARGDVPFSELDALYMHILSSCNDLETVLSILGLVITDVTWATENIELYLDLEPGDAEVALGPLASIINVQPFEKHGPPRGFFIQLRHASFSDFLVDISRSGTFYINTLTIKDHLIPTCISKLMSPYSVTSRNQPGWKLLLMLAYPFGYPFHSLLSNAPLTPTVESALNRFSLPQFWSIWLAEPRGRLMVSYRVYLVSRFLNFLSGKKDLDSSYQSINEYYSLPLGFSTIYESHLSSFESIIQSAVSGYHQDIGLTSLVVISLMDLNGYFDNKYLMPHYNISVRTLLRLTGNSAKLDSDSLCLASPHGRDLLATHYRYLFTGPRTWTGVCPNDEKYSSVALRILEYLCGHPPHPIPFHPKKTTPKPHVSHGKVRRMQFTSTRFLRKRREEKHRYGIALSLPEGLGPFGDHSCALIRQVCEMGLLLLPDILVRSSHSLELVDFMRRRGKDIVFLPKKTRKAIHAMHKYLDRSDEGAKMAE